MSMPKLQILLVDDKLSMLKIQHGLLNRFGHSVVSVKSAAEALMLLSDSADHSKFDLILMDMQMPDIDGLAAAKLMRNQGIQIPILALTGNDCDDQRQDAVAAGMNGYLTKPLSESKLISAWINLR